MKAAVCTLFEGHYHYGVGVLANSLYANGFRGTIYCGFRGELPPWSLSGKTTETVHDFSAAEGLVLRFIRLQTKVHLTNFKPEFMLELWRSHCPAAESIFFFDPDITNICDWKFYEEWVKAGVAVCADVNPSMPPNHPIRHMWQTYYEPHGVRLHRQFELYFNGGFFGVHRNHREFLECWENVQALMAPDFGGMKNVNVGDRTYRFHKTDQDALNIAVMACQSPVSPMGQDGMDLQQGGGGFVMSHAVGGAKPWRKKFLKSVLAGHGPSRADRMFFRHTQTPIQLYSPLELKMKMLVVLAASFLGRFMSKD